MNREAFYLRLPVPLQNLACSLEGWRIQRDRYDRRYEETFRDVRQRGALSEELLLAFRDARLRQFVRHCASAVPYYRHLFHALRIDPEAIRGLDDLKVLPILTKRQVQEEGAALAAETIPARERRTIHTSGTTGAGLHLLSTPAAIQEQYAVWWRYFDRHGIQRDTWCAYFGGRSVVPLHQERPPFWRHNVPGRQILFSAYHISPETAPAFADRLRRSRPPWIHGYPSLLALLAGLMRARGENLGYRPRFVTTGAENLLAHQADLIAEAFGRRPVQHYGMAEAVANISECPAGRLHVDEDFAPVEFVPNAGGDGFRIVGTNVSNPAMPLLRYDVGDLAEPAHGRCDCGISGRLVSFIDGRQEDYVVLRNGARLGRLDHIFKDMTAIREAQIVQDEPGVLLVRVVRNPEYSGEDERALLYEFHKRVGDLAEIRIHHVDRIERSANGKLRFVVSSLPGVRLTPR